MSLDPNHSDSAKGGALQEPRLKADIDIIRPNIEHTPILASPFKSLFLHRCPACQKGKIFTGLFTVRPSCDICNAEFEAHDVGDGAIFGAMTIISFIVVIGAVILEVSITPPFWLHAIIWLPVTLILTVFLLRMITSFLVTSEYIHHIYGKKWKG